MWVEEVAIDVRNTFIHLVDEERQKQGVLKRCSSHPLFTSANEKKPESRRSVKIDDFMATCDTDVGSSGLVSRSSWSRRPWDEVSTDGELSPRIPSTPGDGDDEFFEHTINQLVENEESSGNFAHPTEEELPDKSMRPKRAAFVTPPQLAPPAFGHVSLGYLEPMSIIDGNMAPGYWVVPQPIWGPCPPLMDVSGNWMSADGTAWNPNTETYDLGTVSTSSTMKKKKSGNRKRKNRWAFDNRKNRVSLVVIPNSTNHSSNEDRNQLVGLSGANIQSVTEGNEGAYVVAEATASDSLTVKISAPLVESFLRCRKKTLELIAHTFPHSVVTESDEGMIIKSYSLKTSRRSSTATLLDGSDA